MPAGSPQSVDVVLATRNRPQLLRRAVASVLAQDYDGPITCHVVYDQTEPDPTIEELGDGGRRAVVSHSNTRTPGLPGGRNTGILAGDGSLVGFCDDDDEWLPGKLRAQVVMLDEHPESVLACTGIEIMREGVATARVLDRTDIELSDLLRSRLTELHPSTFVVRRSALAGALGLVDERVPHGYGEDYDLLLRAAALGPVLSVPVVHARIHWHAQSYFAGRWTPMADGLEWLLAHHPEFERDRKGWARVGGQVAFARAAAGRRRESVSWALRTTAHDPLQPRIWLALAVASGAVSPGRVMQELNKRGRGI